MFWHLILPLCGPFPVAISARIRRDFLLSQLTMAQPAQPWAVTEREHQERPLGQASQEIAATEEAWDRLIQPNEKSRNDPVGDPD
jgi:hypothetical protein